MVNFFHEGISPTNLYFSKTFWHQTKKAAPFFRILLIRKLLKMLIIFTYLVSQTNVLFSFNTASSASPVKFSINTTLFIRNKDNHWRKSMFYFCWYPDTLRMTEEFLKNKTLCIQNQICPKFPAHFFDQGLKRQLLTWRGHTLVESNIFRAEIMRKLKSDSES